MASFISDLDTPLLKISPEDHFTLRDACAGVHIFGGIGSGKTSGSGQALAGAYLRAGMGGLVLCAKPEEVHQWRAYAKAHGRTKSLVVFDEEHGFNFIAYELARQGMKGISNVTECLMRVLDAANHATGDGGKEDQAFWNNASRQILNYTIPVLYSAHGTVTVSDIIDFVMSAATHPGMYNDPDWISQSYAGQTLQRIVRSPVLPLDDYAKRSALEYWFKQFPNIPEKTRGNILITLSTRLDRFKQGRLRTSFCDRTTLTPEMTFHGIIIVMAMPTLTWNEDGTIGQQLFKFMWQRAVESRNGLADAQRVRPVFLWADEAQYFANVKDDEFLSTCRGSRACVVFLTQTLPSYYARLGKDKTDAADGLVGKFNTQVFHQNACHRTNTFASQLIGRGLQVRRTSNESVGTNHSRGMNSGSTSSYGTSSSSGTSSGSNGGSTTYSSGSTSSSGTSAGRNVGRGRNESLSWGTSEVMDYRIEPRVFAEDLKAGGPRNHNQVTAVWFCTGAQFKATNGGNVLFPTFRQ